LTGKDHFIEYYLYGPECDLREERKRVVVFQWKKM